MASHVLRGAMDHHVHAQRTGVQVHRGRERSVQDDPDPPRVGERGDRPGIQDAQRRIRRRLEHHDAGLRTDCLRPAPPLGVHEGGLYSTTRQLVPEQRIRRTVEIRRRHDVVARLRERQDRHGRRTHSARERRPGRHALQRRHLRPEEHLIGVVPVPAVEQLPVGRASPQERRALHDGGNHRLTRDTGRFTSVHAAGGEAGVRSVLSAALGHCLPHIR